MSTLLQHIINLHDETSLRANGLTSKVNVWLELNKVSLMNKQCDETTGLGDIVWQATSVLLLAAFARNS